MSVPLPGCLLWTLRVRPWRTVHTGPCLPTASAPWAAGCSAYKSGWASHHCLHGNRIPAGAGWGAHGATAQEPSCTGEALVLQWHRACVVAPPLTPALWGGLLTPMPWAGSGNCPTRENTTGVSITTTECRPLCPLPLPLDGRAPRAVHPRGGAGERCSPGKEPSVAIHRPVSEGWVT